MNITWPPVGVGWILAILVLLLCILGLLSVVPLSPPLVFGMVGALAISRLI